MRDRSTCTKSVFEEVDNYVINTKKEPKSVFLDKMEVGVDVPLIGQCSVIQHLLKS